MFPNATFLTIDLYTWMIILGVVVAVVIFRLLADKRKVSAKVFNFALAVGVCCVAVGYGSAVLFQAFYHWLDSGEWLWNAGATFYGGLIGAAVVFLAAYFGIGHFVFRDKKTYYGTDQRIKLYFPRHYCSALFRTYRLFVCRLLLRKTHRQLAWYKHVDFVAECLAKTVADAVVRGNFPCFTVWGYRVFCFA